MSKPDHAAVEPIVGHVDHVGDDAISGWIANLSNPSRLETVMCQDADGRVVEFHAWHHRADVCDWLQREGRFGFVIPAVALRGLGPDLTILDRQGATLPNGETVRMERAERASDGLTTIFLHIPKTAGTSLRNAIIAGLLPSERLFIYPQPFGLSAFELAALSTRQRRAARLVVGHTYYGIDRLLGTPSRYVTFLREPSARLRSHAAHHARAGTGFVRDGRPASLPAVVQDGLDEEFDNLMVRSVAGLTADLVPLGQIGEKDVDLAMFNVERHFAMVGLVETLAADVSRLAVLLGRPIGPVGAENVTEAFDVGRLRGIDWERVDWRNRFDRMLYDRVRALALQPSEAEAEVRLVPSMFGLDQGLRPGPRHGPWALGSLEFSDSGLVRAGWLG